MIYPIYSIRDRAIGFNSPTIMVNEMVALRSFKQMLQKDPNSDDLELYKIGEFNDETGELKALKVSKVEREE